MEKLSVLLSLVILVTLGCSNKSEVTTNYEDGSVQERFSINTDSLKHGLFTSYRPTGELAETANYENGILEGERKLIYENGKVEIEEHYINDKLHGKYKTFYPSGKLELEMNYQNGIIEGKSVKYYESGNLMEEVTFENNEEQGPFVEYHENGNKKWEGSYLKGENEVGLLLNYDQDGTLVKKMICDSMSICQTIWTLEKGDISPDKLFDKE